MTSILVSISITICFHWYNSRSVRLNQCKCYQNIWKHVLCIMVGAKHPNAHDIENRRIPFPRHILICRIYLPINLCSIGAVTLSAQEQHFAITNTDPEKSCFQGVKRNIPKMFQIVPCVTSCKFHEIHSSFFHTVAHSHEAAPSFRPQISLVGRDSQVNYFAVLCPTYLENVIKIRLSFFL